MTNPKAPWITPRAENAPVWYADVLRLGDVVDAETNTVGEHGRKLWDRLRQAWKASSLPLLDGQTLTTAAFDPTQEQTPSTWQTAELGDEQQARTALDDLVHRMSRFVEQRLALPIECVTLAPSEAGVLVYHTIAAAVRGGTLVRVGCVRLQRNEAPTPAAFRVQWQLLPTSLGATVWQHGDDRGLILPPRIANADVVITPQRGVDHTEELRSYGAALARYVGRDDLTAVYDDEATPATQPHFGTPVVLEIGPEQLTNAEVVVKRRLEGDTLVWPKMGLRARMVDYLDAMRLQLLAQGKQALLPRTTG